MFVGPDLMSVLIWIQTVCKGDQQTTNVGARGQRVKPYSAAYIFKFLAYFVASLKIQIRPII